MALVLVVAMAGTLASCTTFDNFKNTFFGDKNKDNTIYIGVLEPETGEDGQFGKEEIQGIEFAHEMCPTVLDKNIELVYENTQSSTYVTESAVKELISKNPVAILGCYGNTNALIAAEYIEEAKIPAIGISVTNNLLTDNHKYYTSVSFNDTLQGRALGKYTRTNLFTDKVAIFRQNDDDSSEEVTNRFIKEVRASKKHPIKVRKFNYGIDETDYTKYLQEILADDIDKVFAPISIEAADLLFQQIEALEMTNITFIGTNLWYNDEFLTMMNKHPEIKVVIASEFTADKATNKEEENFISMFKARYGQDAEPTQRMALAYDAYMLAIRSIEKAGSTDGEAINNAILNTKGFKGVTGTIRFNSKGGVSKAITISTLQNHEFVTLDTIE